MGMTYECSTSHHFAEYVCQVPYRHTTPLVVGIRRHDGSLVKQRMTDYQPLPGRDGSYYDREPDFNKLGRMLEERDLVGITAIGNAIVRLFKMRDLVELAKTEAARDHNVFRVSEGREGSTSLRDGKAVLSPEMLDGAGRSNRYQWCVVDPKSIFSRDKPREA